MISSNEALEKAEEINAVNPTINAYMTSSKSTSSSFKDFLDTRKYEASELDEAHGIDGWKMYYTKLYKYGMSKKKLDEFLEDPDEFCRFTYLEGEQQF